MNILYNMAIASWNAPLSPSEEGSAIQAIEAGQIISLPALAFNLLPNESTFLSAKYAHPKAKNISFNIQLNKLNGALGSEFELNQIKMMLQRYCHTARDFIMRLFPPYKGALIIGRTSFRPVEILGRVSSYRKDDTRLHVDAFPATPNQGQRILRIFTNINPQGQERVWRVGEPFAKVVAQFLPTISRYKPFKSALLKKLKMTKSYRTHYDHLMLQIHDQMKANLTYQKEAEQTEIRFAPGESWIVQTDHVSHAAMSGQHVLEQTFYLPVQAMVNPELAPLSILENVTQSRLI